MIRRRTILGWAAALYAASGIYLVQPDEQAVVRRFGQALPQVSDPGAHWGLPWPWDRVARLRPRETKRVALGIPDTTSGKITIGASQFLTGDRNLVNVRATVQYTVADAARFLFHAAELERTVRAAAEAILTESLAVQGVDRALTLGKRELGVEAAEHLQSWCDKYQLGITIRSVDLAAVEPPPEVA